MKPPSFGVVDMGGQRLLSARESVDPSQTLFLFGGFSFDGPALASRLSESLMDSRRAFVGVTLWGDTHTEGIAYADGGRVGGRK